MSIITIIISTTFITINILWISSLIINQIIIIMDVYRHVDCVQTPFCLWLMGFKMVSLRW
jgi:hypothetical protein